MRVIIHGYANDTDGWLDDFKMPNKKIISSGLRETFREVVKHAKGGFFASVTAAQLSKNGRSERTHRRRLDRLCNDCGLLAKGQFFDEKTGKEKRGYFLRPHKHIERRYEWEKQHEPHKHQARYRHGGQYIFEISESTGSDATDVLYSGSIFGSGEDNSSGPARRIQTNAGDHASERHTYKNKIFMDYSALNGFGGACWLLRVNGEGPFGNLGCSRNDRSCESGNPNDERPEYSGRKYIQQPCSPGQWWGLPPLGSALPGQPGILGGLRPTASSVLGKKRNVGNCSINQQESDQCRGGSRRDKDNKSMSLPSSSGFVGGRGALLGKSGISSSASDPNSVDSNGSLLQNTPEKTGHVSDKLGTKCPILGSRLDNNIKYIFKNPIGVAPKTCPAIEAEQGEGEDIFTDIDASTEAPVSDLPEMPQDEAWIAAKAAICTSSPYLRPLLNQLDSRRSADSTLSLDGPSAPVINTIERQYGELIAEALRRVGVDRHQYNVLPPLLRQKKNIATQAIMNGERIMEARQRQQVAAARAMRLAQLTPAQQFQELEAAYPVGKSSEKTRTVFLKMLHRGEIPPLPILLSALSEQKNSHSWQNHNGKYIPQLINWLSKRQWEKE